MFFLRRHGSSVVELGNWPCQVLLLKIHLNGFLPVLMLFLPITSLRFSTQQQREFRCNLLPAWALACSQPSPSFNAALYVLPFLCIFACYLQHLYGCCAFWFASSSADSAFAPALLTLLSGSASCLRSNKFLWMVSSNWRSS